MPENKKIHCTVAGQPARINPAGHYISFLIDVSSLGRDSSGPIYTKIYENGKLYESGVGTVKGTDDQYDNVLLFLDTYWDKNDILWIKPATYKLDFYFDNKFFKSVTFSVNENGLC